MTLPSKSWKWSAYVEAPASRTTMACTRPFVMSRRPASIASKRRRSPSASVARCAAVPPPRFATNASSEASFTGAIPAIRDGSRESGAVVVMSARRTSFQFVARRFSSLALRGPADRLGPMESKRKASLSLSSRKLQLLRSDCPLDTALISATACKKLLFPESFLPMSTVSGSRVTVTSSKHLYPRTRALFSMRRSS